MRAVLFFYLLAFQQIFVAVCAGLISAVFVYLFWGLYTGRKESAEEKKAEARGYEIGSARELWKNPIAPLLIAFYLGIALWVLAYFIVNGIVGGSVV